MKKSRYTNKLSVLKEYKESERFGDIEGEKYGMREREIEKERQKERKRNKKR